MQYEVVDCTGRTWRLDFAWPGLHVAVEYDGFDWHSDQERFRRDRQKRAALIEEGWWLLSVVFDDVRMRPSDMLRRIEIALERAQNAA